MINEPEDSEASPLIESFGWWSLEFGLPAVVAEPSSLKPAHVALEEL
jgi:hypothetical protein